jgi:conflict system STAND superfamily ATPase
VQDNPFTYGNPISDPLRFFGRTREVEQIFGRLRNAECESSSVVGDRRIGKTSLLNHLADPGVRAVHGLTASRYSFVYADLQMVDEAMGPEQLWRRLLRSLGQELPGDDPMRAALDDLLGTGRFDTFDLGDFFQRLDDNGRYVVFLLDEFDRVTANSRFGPDFYFGFRALAIHRNVALVTSSRLELVELCHSEEIRSSPFFNIFANISLRMFSAGDFDDMITKSLAGTDVRFSETELEQVLDLAGLHPYFLQAACWVLYDAYRQRLDAAGRRASLAERFDMEAVPHLVDYWLNSGDHEKIVLTAAALLERQGVRAGGFGVADLRRVFSRAEPSAARLERRGLLMRTDAGYRLFSAVLGPWILDQISADLAERQSYPEWLAQHKGAKDLMSDRQGKALRDVLPRVGARYRQLILTWASDPQSVAAMAGLLKSVLDLVG